MDQLNVEGLSTEEINALLEKLKSEKEGRKEGERKELIEEIKRKAAALDIPLEEIADELTKGSKRKSSKIAPKYRNPNDSSVTWTGRGRAPKWMQDLINQGRDKEEFSIQ